MRIEKTGTIRFKPNANSMRIQCGQALIVTTPSVSAKVLHVLFQLEDFMRLWYQADVVASGITGEFQLW